MGQGKKDWKHWVKNHLVEQLIRLISQQHEVTMQQGLLLCERLHGQIIQQLNSNISQYEIANNSRFDHLKYIILLKDSENLIKSACKIQG